MSVKVGIEKLGPASYAVVIFTPDVIHRWAFEAPLDVPDRERVALEMARASATGAYLGFIGGVSAERIHVAAGGDYELPYIFGLESWMPQGPDRSSRLKEIQRRREKDDCSSIIEWVKPTGGSGTVPTCYMVPAA